MMIVAFILNDDDDDNNRQTKKSAIEEKNDLILILLLPLLLSSIASIFPPLFVISYKIILHLLCFTLCLMRMCLWVLLWGTTNVVWCIFALLIWYSIWVWYELLQHWLCKYVVASLVDFKNLTTLYNMHKSAKKSKIKCQLWLFFLFNFLSHLTHDHYHHYHQRHHHITSLVPVCWTSVRFFSLFFIITKLFSFSYQQLCSERLMRTAMFHGTNISILATVLRHKSN